MKKSRNFRVLLFLMGLGLLFGFNELLIANFGVAVENTGVSFGLNIGGIFINIVILAVLGRWVIRKGEDLWLGLVWIGGGLNLIERIRFGFVRDYWPLPFGLYNNLADWLIALGFGMFIINLWMKRSK